MSLNSNHIFEFIKQQWMFSKSSIALEIGCNKSALSRKAPYKYEVSIMYKSFFETNPNEKGRALSEKEKSNLLDELYYFMEINGFKNESKYIATNRENKIEYKRIILEILNSAITEQTVLSEATQKNIPSQPAPPSTITGLDDTITATDVLIQNLPSVMQKEAQKIRNKNENL